MREVRIIVILLVSISFFTLSCKKSPEKAYSEFIAAGDKSMAENNYQQAAIFYNNAIKVLPKKEAYIKLAQAYLDGKEADYAISALAKAIKIDPNDPVLYIMVAKAHNNKSRWDKAVSALVQAGKLNPDIADLWATFALNYVGQLYFDEGEYSANQALKIDQDNADAKRALFLIDSLTKETKKEYALADSFFNLKSPTEIDYNKAYFIYLKIIKSNPLEIDALKKIIVCLKKMKAFDEAKKYSEQLKESEAILKLKSELTEEQWNDMVLKGKKLEDLYNEKVKTKK